MAGGGWAAPACRACWAAPAGLPGDVPLRLRARLFPWTGPTLLMRLRLGLLLCCRFASKQGRDQGKCEVAQRIHAVGHELATHSVLHSEE